MIILGSVVAIAVIAWLGFLLFGNNYKSNAMKMKVNTIVASRLAAAILSDYQENWVRVETEHLASNDQGVIVSTDDAKQVLKWRQDFFKANGASNVLEQLMGDIKQEVGSMNLTPARYRDTQANFKSAYEHISELVDLTRQPGDSLIAMSEKMAQLLADLDKDIEPTDFNFFVNFDEIREVAEKIGAQISDKNVAAKLSQPIENQQQSVVNALKYRKMGFVELPKGKGVLYHELTKGKGQKPKDDSRVKLHYEGKLMDGTVFDSSYKRGEPVTMLPQQTVPGFWHSLVCMSPGAKWEIFIPSNQAYGPRAAGAVKPNSDLFFTIEVLEVE